MQWRLFEGNFKSCVYKKGSCISSCDLDIFIPSFISLLVLIMLALWMLSRDWPLTSQNETLCVVGKLNRKISGTVTFRDSHHHKQTKAWLTWPQPTCLYKAPVLTMCSGYQGTHYLQTSISLTNKTGHDSRFKNTRILQLWKYEFNPSSHVFWPRLGLYCRRQKQAKIALILQRRRQ